MPEQNFNVDAVYIGPPKSASTWLWKCFKEHPDICVPKKLDSTHYFTFRYKTKDLSWYEDLFSHRKDNQLCVDFCNNYLQSPKAVKRIAEHSPDVKILTGLRNPVDRAFSHYWHSKKKKTFPYDFKDVLERYNLYQTFIVPGFYRLHLRRYKRHFSDRQIFVQLYQNLQDNSKTYFESYLEFLGVSSFEPSLITNKVNEAGYKRNIPIRTIAAIGELVSRIGFSELADGVSHSRGLDFIKALLSNKDEYEKGMSEDMKERLELIYHDDLQQLQKLP